MGSVENKALMIKAIPDLLFIIVAACTSFNIDYFVIIAMVEQNIKLYFVNRIA